MLAQVTTKNVGDHSGIAVHSDKLML